MQARSNKPKKAPRQGPRPPRNRRRGRGRNNASRRVLANYQPRQAVPRNQITARRSEYREILKSQLNPFSDAAKGATTYHGGSARVVPYQIHHTFDLSTITTSGLGAMMFVPSVPYGYQINAAGSNTFTVAALSSYGVSSIDFSKYRIVSAGLKIHPLLGASEAKGFINILHVEEYLDTATINMADLTLTTGGHFQAYDSKKIMCVFQKRDHTADEYLGASTASLAPSGWRPIIVQYAGGSTAGATAGYRIELVINVEFLVDYQSVFHNFSVEAKPKIPEVITHVSKVHGDIPAAVVVHDKADPENAFDQALDKLFGKHDVFGIDAGKAVNNIADLATAFWDLL